MAAAQMKPESTAVALREPKGITQLLQSDAARDRITPLLPRGVSYDAVVQEVFFAAKDNPEILECSPDSIVRAVGRAVQSGLSLGREIHLVPFNTRISRKGEPDRWEKRLTTITDYKGEIALIVSSGAARSIDARCVYANERFRYEEGLNPILEHEPMSWASSEVRGPLVGAYAIARLPKGGAKTLAMSVAEIDAIRQAHSRQWRKGDVPVWYAKKTVVHQIAKELPQNPRLAALLRAIEAHGEEDDVEPRPDDVPAPALIPSARTVDEGEGRDEDSSGLPMEYTLRGDDQELALDDERPARRPRSPQSEGR